MKQLISLCLGTQLNSPTAAEWRQLFDAADREHVTALLRHFSGWPEEAAARVTNATAKTDADARMLKFEIDRLARALWGTGIEPILLKGGAYLAIGHPVARGRRVSDLDILVKPDQLHTVERALRAAGFIDHMSAADPFIQRYYRDDMHELPPLVHSQRRTVIDVHHALTPPGGRLQIDLSEMIFSAVQVAGLPLRVFQPQDMFLHAAVHALYDGELDTPVRTTLDLAKIYQALSAEDKAGLSARAKTLGLSQALGAAQSLLESSGLDVCKRQDSGRIIGFLAAKGATSSGIIRVVVQHIFRWRGHYLRMKTVPLIRYFVLKTLWTVRNRAAKDL